jgi:hypothetical protein
MEANGQDIRPEPLERAQEKATPKSSLLCEHESRLRSVDGKNGSVKQAEAVQRFLQQNAGKEFCHNCLARAVGFKSVHRSIIQLINNPFFARRRGRCEACASHRPKLVTRYRGKPSPHDKRAYRSAKVRLWTRTRSVQRIALRQRPDAGMAEDEEPELSGHLRSELATAPDEPAPDDRTFSSGPRPSLRSMKRAASKMPHCTGVSRIGEVGCFKSIRTSSASPCLSGVTRY